MVEEEERSEVKGHAPSVPSDGKRSKSGSLTLSSDDHSEEEDVDANMAAAGVERLVIEQGGRRGEEEGERRRELPPAASDASSSGEGDDINDGIALSSLLRYVSPIEYSRVLTVLWFFAMIVMMSKVNRCCCVLLVP